MTCGFLILPPLIAFEAKYFMRNKSRMMKLRFSFKGCLDDLFQVDALLFNALSVFSDIEGFSFFNKKNFNNESTLFNLAARAGTALQPICW
jgi:hypothetical protein